jgi:hypothetical protein
MTPTRCPTSTRAQSSRNRSLGRTIHRSTIARAGHPDHCQPLHVTHSMCGNHARQGDQDAAADPPRAFVALRAARLPGTRNLMVPMTTSHAPATIPRTTIELIGRAITAISAPGLSTPVKMCQPRSGNSLWLIARTVLIVVYRNLIQVKTSSGHQDSQRTLPKWFRGYL